MEALARVSTVFDYESKVWGAHEVRLSPRYLGALRLKYCLEDLAGVQGKVVEVGCGAGGMARAIRTYRRDLEVFGCDLSRKAVAAGRKHGGGVTFEVGDALALPFPDASFSAAVMLDVLEHLEDPGQAIAEAFRVLRGDGRLHLFVPCEGELATIHGLLARVGWRSKEKYGGHIQRFTARALFKLLEGRGFSVRRRRWSSHLINQVVDAAYFSMLSLRGRNAAYSVEGYLEQARPSGRSALVRAAKEAIAVASYWESTLGSWMPGAGIHLLCVKPAREDPADVWEGMQRW